MKKVINLYFDGNQALLFLNSENLLIMLLWLGELSFASWVLSYGAEHLSLKFGAKFVGRTLLSVATTLPEIAIVIYASAAGLYDVAIGAGLGSNILMMTLGLALMLLIATTRLSRAPLKQLDISSFKSDKLFLLGSALLSAILLIDGYNYVDGFVFVGIFVGYIFIAFAEMKKENKIKRENRDKDAVKAAAVKPLSSVESSFQHNVEVTNPQMTKAIMAFAIGTLGIAIGASPFIHSLQSFSVDIGVSTIVLAVIISPIAGEMPEKISMMILARKGAAGASIAIANVLGSKVLNNSLLLAVAIFAAMYHGGFFTIIENNAMLGSQMVLATSITLIALVPLFRRTIGLKVGVFLLALYLLSIVVQFFMPGAVVPH
jgi:cation:H+ antiporter